VKNFLQFAFRIRLGFVCNLFFLMLAVTGRSKNSGPLSPDHSWASPDLQLHQQALRANYKEVPDDAVIDSRKIYQLPDLFDVAERLNPETRIAWQKAIADSFAGSVPTNVEIPLNELVQYALIQQPDMITAFADIRSTEARISQIKASHFPRISAVGSLGYGQERLSGHEEVSIGVEEIYVDCLPWLRVQTRLTERTQAGQYQRASREVCGRLARRMEKLAFLLESDGFEETGSPERFEGAGTANSQSFDLRSVETLERSVQRLESLLRTAKQHR
jgi:Outer membrane efflux protein